MTKTEKTKTIDLATLNSPEKALKAVKNQETFNKGLQSVLKQEVKTSEEIHVLAIDSLVQAFAHDNFDYLMRLYNTCKKMRNGENIAKQITKWAETYSPAQLRTTKSGKSFRKDKRDTANEFDFIEAMQNPWYAVKLLTEDEAAKKYGSKELEAAMLSLIKKAKKAVKQEGKFATEQKDVPAMKARIRVLESALETVIPSAANNENDVVSEGEKESDNGDDNKEAKAA